MVRDHGPVPDCPVAQSAERRIVNARAAGSMPAWTANNGDLGVTAALRNVNPPVPVRFRQISPQALPHPVKEFFVNAIAAGEARESSLARFA